MAKQTNDKRIRLQLLLASVLILGMDTVQAGGNDDPLLTKVMIDQLEVREADHGDPLVFEGQLWVGRDLHKLWLKGDAEKTGGKTEEVEVQALYSRAVAPFWDFQLGLRKDLLPSHGDSWAVIGFQGVAPYLFEVDSALFVSEGGQTALRLEAEYELMLTQRWVLSPEIEANFYGKNDEDSGRGSGLSDMEIGLRLRYEFRREFAPYIGLSWDKKFGNTADFSELEGEDTEDLQLVLGIRAWF